MNNCEITHCGVGFVLCHLFNETSVCIFPDWTVQFNQGSCINHMIRNLNTRGRIPNFEEVEETEGFMYKSEYAVSYATMMNHRRANLVKAVFCKKKNRFHTNSVWEGWSVWSFTDISQSELCLPFSPITLSVCLF